MKATVGEKGQVTIPKALRSRLGIGPGDVLDFDEKKGVLLARRAESIDPLEALRGLLRGRIETDAFLEESRGPRWNSKTDGRRK